MIDIDVGMKVGDFDLAVAFHSGAGITALWGASGAGKSLILSLIAGLTRPDRGRIAVGGRVLVDVGRGVFVPPHRRRVGLVFQDSNLFPHMNVRRNLLFGRRFAPCGEPLADIAAVTATLGIGGLLDRRPGSLSGGEKQRVAIGRALLSCPRLLLFDEPLAALDMARRQEIMPLIEKIRDDFNIPILYVSHAAEEVARLAATVIVIEAGRVKTCGTPSEIFGARPA